EDPRNNFLPAAGNILEWDAAESIEGLRIDAGIERGSEVGIHYDPMLAKLIAHAPDRVSAGRKLGLGLTALFAPDVETHRGFLPTAIDHPSVASGNFDTSFVETHLDELIAATGEGDDLTSAAIVALFINARMHRDAAILPDLPQRYRNNPFRDPSMKLQIGDRE